MNKLPLISVIIPTYKGEDLIVSTLEKVVKQTYSNLEIIVVDDNGLGTTHQIKTEEVIKSKFPMVKYTILNENSGVTTARNRGSEVANGEYLNFLDQDDDLLPEKIARQFEIFHNGDSILGLVYCSRIEKYVETGNEKMVQAKFRGDLKGILGLNHIGPPSVSLIKGEAFKKVGGFSSKYRFKSEIELYLRIAQWYAFNYVSEPLVVYNRRSGTFSSNKILELNEMILFVDEYGFQFNKDVTAQVQERLGELYAINGEIKKALGAFYKAIYSNPRRFKTVIKAFLSLGGKDFYRRIRGIN